MIQRLIPCSLLSFIVQIWPAWAQGGKTEKKQENKKKEKKEKIFFPQQSSILAPINIKSYALPIELSLLMLKIVY